MIKIVNPKAKVKPECYKCGYLDKSKSTYYKCCVRGTCPAAPPRTK